MALKELDKYTAASILQTALNEATDAVDKREGSILYDATAPLATVLAQVLELFKRALENSEIQTAQGLALDSVASQYAIYRTPAKPAIKEAQATPPSVKLKLGSLFQTREGLGFTWQVSEILGGGKYVLVCKTDGPSGGNDPGPLAPVQSIDALQSLVFTATRSPGIDAESDEDFRLRIWKVLQRKNFGGNFADYQNWIFNEFPSQNNGANFKGILFFPAWDGGGTIKLVPYIENDGRLEAPTDEALTALKNFLDPDAETGLGKGIAPVGHRVTVEAPVFLNLPIQVEVIPNDPHAPNLEALKKAAEDEVKKLIHRKCLEALTLKDSGFPEKRQFALTPDQLTTAIMGPSEQTRFFRIKAMKIDGNQFTEPIIKVLDASNHDLPRFYNFDIKTVEE